MKFQKDNSSFALTQEMKDAIVAKKEAEIEAKATQIERNEAQLKEIRDKMEWAEGEKAKVQELEKQFREIMEPVSKRVMQYGTFSDQLDRLWHDIDTGRIQADKTSANSWYSTIKSIKDSVPLQDGWDTKGHELTIQMQTINSQLTANNV